MRSAIHFPRRLQLHICRDPWNIRRNHRTLFPWHYYWSLHFSRSCAIDLFLGEERDGEDGRARAFEDRARVSLVVFHAWRLHRHSRLPILDGMDFSRGHLDLEPTGCQCTIRLRHLVHFHHQVCCSSINRRVTKI
jgi:hypothetical protein